MTPEEKAREIVRLADMELTPERRKSALEHAIAIAIREAEARVKRLEEAWDSYDGNNPNKYRSSIRVAELEASNARAALRALEAKEKPAPY